MSAIGPFIYDIDTEGEVVSRRWTHVDWGREFRNLIFLWTGLFCKKIGVGTHRLKLFVNIF